MAANYETTNDNIQDEKSNTAWQLTPYYVIFQTVSLYYECFYLVVGFECWIFDIHLLFIIFIPLDDNAEF